MIILGVDLGKTRTGLAVCDKGESFAFPRGIIKEYNREKLFSKIAAEAQKEGAELIVVGLPRNMDGSEGFKAEESREAAEKLKALSGLPVALMERQGKTLRIFNGAEPEEVMSLFTDEYRRGRILPGKKRIVVKEYPSEAAVLLTESGFLREMQDYVLYR